MVAVDKAAARITATVLGLFIVGIIAILIRVGRRSRYGRCFVIIGSYDVVLLALWAGATLIDDGYGAMYLPGLILTAPWSFLAMFLAVKGPAGVLFTSGWIANFIENFVVFVILCGGLNNLLLYFVIRRWFNAKPVSAPGS